MSEDISLINILSDAVVVELDRQYMDGELDYFDDARVFAEGEIDVDKLVRAVLRSLREVEGE